MGRKCTRRGFVRRDRMRWMTTLLALWKRSGGRWRPARQATLSHLRDCLARLEGAGADIIRALIELVTVSRVWAISLVRAAILRARLSAQPTWAVLPEPRLPKRRRDGGDLVLAELSAHFDG